MYYVCKEERNGQIEGGEVVKNFEIVRGTGILFLAAAALSFFHSTHPRREKYRCVCKYTFV